MLPGLGLGLLTGLVSAMLTGLDPGLTAVSLSVVFNGLAITRSRDNLVVPEA